MKLERVFKVFSSVLMMLVSAACSSPDSNGTPNGNNNNQNNVVNEVSVRIFSRSSWQDVGFKVKAGDRIRIVPTGTWTGGQLTVGDRSENTQAQFCDANGCNGDAIKTFWSHPQNQANPYRYTEIATPGTASGASSNPNGQNRVILHEFFEQNVLRNQGQSYGQQKQGFGGANEAGTAGLLDGKTLCFANDNTFLGANTVLSKDLKTGHWYKRAKEWEYYRNVFQHGANVGGMGAHANVVATVTQLNRLITLYENATCEMPPQEVMENNVRKLETTLAALDDLWTGIHEHAYRPVYYVQVPTNNYGVACRSDAETITNFYLGKPSSYINKNDCAPAAKNVLIMKIVDSNDEFGTQTPIVVGRQYETIDYIVPKSGYIFLKNNDADTGIFDNGTLDDSFIDVRIRRASTTN